MVVDGEKGFVGSVEKAIAVVSAAKSRKRTWLSVAAMAAESRKEAKVQVRMRSPPAGAQLWIFVTQSGLSSKVTRGENEGRTLRHAAVVRSAFKVAAPSLGDVGVGADLDPTWDTSKLRIVAVLQDPLTSRIYGAASAAITPFKDR